MIIYMLLALSYLGETRACFLMHVTKLGIVTCFGKVFDLLILDLGFLDSNFISEVFLCEEKIESRRDLYYFFL